MILPTINVARLKILKFKNIMNKYLIIFLAIALLVAGGFWAYGQSRPAETSTETKSTTTSTSDSPSTTTPVAKVAFTIQSCEDTWDSTRPAWSKWRKIINDLHPAYAINNLGNHCILSDGSHLIGFSYQETINGASHNEQKITWLDKNLKIIKETKGLFHPTPGDFVAPSIEKLEDPTLFFNLDSSDAGNNFPAKFSLNMNTFQYKKI